METFQNRKPSQRFYQGQ